MIKLLMRFYDVNSGAIKIDGHNIKDFNRSELRQMFGMVLQDTWLFSGSIEDNIKYGKLDATHEEVVAAAKAAHVHRFVQTLPSGYNMTSTKKPSNVSQGTETASHNRQSHPRRSKDPDPRRSHQLRRHQNRSTDPESHG